MIKTENDGNKESKADRKPNRQVALDLIPGKVHTRVHNQFMKNLMRREIYNPRKMKIKEFENFVEENIESVNLMIRQSGIILKRAFHDLTISEDQMVTKLEEAISMSSLAGKQVN